MSQAVKLNGTSSPFALYQFVKNPYAFATKMYTKHGDTYWFKLNGKKLIVTSNSEIISKLKLQKTHFFEPEEIAKSLGDYSLILNNINHELSKKQFVKALSKLKFNRIENIINENKQKYLGASYINGKDLVCDILADVLANLCANDTTSIHISAVFKQSMENLTNNVMFLPFCKNRFTSWDNYRWHKKKLDIYIKNLFFSDESFYSILLKEGCDKSRALDNTFLFLFAGYDNPAMLISNTLWMYGFCHDFIENLDVYIEMAKNICPPAPFTVKTTTLGFTWQDLYFEAGTDFAIDLIHYKEVFGFGNKKCPGENLTYLIIKPIIRFLHTYFYSPSNVIYGRLRFSHGPISFVLERK